VRHLDAYEGSSTRRVTCIYYINPYWKEEDGGQLRIFHEGAQGVKEEFDDIAPCGNRLLIFQSRQLEHEVLPTYFERYALTVWFY